MTTKPIPVPCLSLAGWVSSPSEKADALIAHFYESDKAQTLIFGDHVSNLQYVVEQYGHDIIALQQNLRIVLETYLGRYYDAVNVEIQSNNSMSDPVAKIELRVYADVTDGDQHYSFGKLLMISNSKIEKIASLNNTGSAPAVV